MNKEQAGHILDAYVRMRMRESDTDASDALREVILDAMTGYRTSYVSTYPHTITVPTGTGGWSSSETIVTCNGGGE